jgi:hypothetical protein
MKRPSCKAFVDYLVHKTEEFDAEIIKSLQPLDTWIGTVETPWDMASWRGDGIIQFWSPHDISPWRNRNLERFDRVFPDLTGEWQFIVGKQQP